MPSQPSPVLTANGITKTHAEWEKELGLKRRSIYARLRRGLTPEEAVQPPMRESPEDVIGRRYGLLLVVSLAESNTVKSFVKVKCDCGVEKSVAVGNLKNGSTNSCGCKRDEDFRKRITKHGRTTGCDGLSSRLEPEYKIWRGLRDRCRNENNSRYECYGGRGVTFDPRWMDYEAFLADVGRRPGPGYSIDRIDVNGNYCKENCRWATHLEQMNNTRSNVRVTFRGESLTISQWSVRTGIPYKTLHNRLSKCSSPEEVEKALTSPLGSQWRRKGKENG